MGSRLFGPLTSSNISVGYIDPDIGFVEGVSIVKLMSMQRKILELFLYLKLEIRF